MSAQEHEKNVTALADFLLLPAEPGLTEPPPIPLSLDGLPAAVYLDAALRYVEKYPFDREFKRKNRKRYLYSEWKERARTYLQACIKVDRSPLAPLQTSGSYDAVHEQQEFIRRIVFPRRWKLEELASEMLALVELCAFSRQSVSRCLRLWKYGRRREQRLLYRRLWTPVYRRSPPSWTRSEYAMKIAA
ncbi:hypothetical protein B0H16DRAFT_1492628 [Mycena metata]|uniref:Uncharacterized protein n=1 Tax=Mycena metata TaxID=1033252 RepID=A0AAD7KGX7_9AGAR|nr:hypothetical protein B0H16DRAFT_1492628 [Mycena metata]